MNKILIVGGGTAGKTTALILKQRFPHIDIHIVESTKVGIVGVGEGSTEHWADFCNFCNINFFEVVRECDATFKIGIYYDNWDDETFMHSILPPFDSNESGYYYNYAQLIANNRPKRSLQHEYTWNSRVSLTHFNNDNDVPVLQFHFNTNKLNQFLTRKCKEKGIEIFNDDIVDVELNERGDIKVIKSESRPYAYDFYVDCTGFRRLLMTEHLGVEWKSYSDYLPLNSAIAFPTEEMEEYNMYTKATRRNAGWSWHIPVVGRTGNGYVYQNNYITKDQAVQEIEESLGHPIEVAKEFTFNPGRLIKFWEGNCAAIGLSASFVEPLEATSIGSSIQQAFMLMNFLPSRDSVRFNDLSIKMFDNIVDYIVAHYLTRKEDTPFWKDYKNTRKIPDSLQYYLDQWRNRLPSESDCRTPWGMFSGINYIPVLYGLNWFDTAAIKKELDINGLSYRAQEQIDDARRNIDGTLEMGHKEAIKRIRGEL